MAEEGGAGAVVLVMVVVVVWCGVVWEREGEGKRRPCLAGDGGGRAGFSFKIANCLPASSFFVRSSRFGACRVSARRKRKEVKGRSTW